MALRKAKLKDYGQTLPIQIQKGKSLCHALDYQILVLLVYRATSFHVDHRLIDSLQIFLTKW